MSEEEAIKAHVVVDQKTNTSNLKIVDKEATVIIADGLTRLVYQEAPDVQVTLDISESESVLRRYGNWVSVCYFSKDSSWVQIHSDEGRLDFDIEVLLYVKAEDSLRVQYQMLNSNNEIDTFTYECSWDKEEKSWQEIH